MVELVDGCCDLSVVTIGTLSACGVSDDPFLMEVDQNNLDKFGDGHSYREDGKLIKPPDHQPPRIEELLEDIRPKEEDPFLPPYVYTFNSTLGDKVAVNAVSYDSALHSATLLFIANYGNKSKNRTEQQKEYLTVRDSLELLHTNDSLASKHVHTGD
jgi:hypothetical protein